MIYRQREEGESSFQRRSGLGLSGAMTSKYIIFA
jgi:hypothetical protein